MTGAYYGLFLAIAIFVTTKLMPQPAGAVTLFALYAVWLSRAAVICWRRTGLPFMTAALVNGAVMSMCLIVLIATGRPYEDLGLEGWLIIGGFSVTAAFFVHIESRVNRQKMDEWRRYAERKNLWDVLRGRHIPQLRNGGHLIP